MGWDLRTFLAELEAEPGEVVRVRQEVDRDYDTTAWALEFERRGRWPVLWFERVRGSRFPVVTNLFGSRTRLARALGVAPGELTREWVRRGDRLIKPVEQATGPVKEVVTTGDAVDLGHLPILRHFAEDGGPYITNAIVVARDPDTGVRNASYHRMQLKGPRRLGTSLHSRRHLWDYQQRAEARGEALPVAIVVGAHPLFHIGGGLWKGPIDVDEYEVVGGFLGEPLEVVPGETAPVDVPARAEVVIEGRILPGVREPEGPFAEFTGYAAERSTQHVVEVTAITHRRDALYQDIVSGISAEHTALLAVPMEARLLKVLRAQHPGVRDVAFPQSACCRFHCYVSLKKTAEGQAQNVIFAALGEDLSLKLVVVVDDDVDVHDEREVLWAVATRMQADEALIVVPRCMGAILDPSSKAGLTAKWGIDATRPLSGFARRHTLPPDAVARVRAMIERAEQSMTAQGRRDA